MIPSQSERHPYSRFSGTWRQLYCWENGEHRYFAKNHTQQVYCRFQENLFLVVNETGQRLIEGYFTLATDGMPTSVDWTDTCGEDAGLTFPAFYEITPDHLRFCAADAHLPRPRACTRQAGHTIRVFTRIAPDDKQPIFPQPQ